MQREQSPRTPQDAGGRSRTEDGPDPGPGAGGPGRRSARDRVLAARGAAAQSRGPAGPPEAAGSTVGAADPVPADPGKSSRQEGLELEERLGESEGTRTWRAREHSSREEFAVTFAVAEDPAVRKSLEEQFAELAGEWSHREHPHLVCVRATLGDESRATALVTQHCPGTTLARRMHTEGRLSPEEVTPVLSAVARALAQLHEHGWVHGRLTPEHVLLTPDGGALVDGYGARHGAQHPGPAWGLGERTETPVAPPHGPGAQHPGSVGHGPLPASSPHDDAAWPGAAAHAPEQVPSRARGTMTPAGDVHALGVLGWRALTGRLPGPDSHRVPLTLMCPSAPRHLVLMLEAALCDDPAQRPSAHELAAGFDTAVPAPRPARAPARRPEDRMTPEVIRADGTVVRSRRLRRPLRTGSRASSGAVGGARGERDTAGWRRRRELRRGNPGRRTAGTVAEAAGTDPRRRWWLALAAALLVAAVAWGTTRWAPSSEAGARPAAATSSAAAPSSQDVAGARQAEPTRGLGVPRPESTGSARASAGDRPGGSTKPADPHPGPESTPDSPGASAQDRDREAQQAVKNLVAARAAALATGDEAAVDAVYVPESRLAAKDREVIRRAGAQDTGGTGFTAFSGISMEVVELAEQKRGRDARVSPAEAARTRTYRAEVLTRGWHGDVPSGSHVTRKDGEAVQSLRISVVQTPEGWRLTDVTPVADGR